MSEAEASLSVSVADNIADTMRELHDCIQQLEDLGLRLDPHAVVSADEIEQVLITDSWSCPICGETNASLCLTSGKPHRRRLVTIALHVLHLVEQHVGRVYMRSAQLAQRVEGEVQARTQRRLLMNPHTFLLAFFFACGSAPKTTEDDAGTPVLIAECARHLLDVLREIKVYGGAPMDDKYSLSLLKSFRGALRQYARQMKRDMAKGDEAPAHNAREELVSCTRSALMEAVAQAQTDPDNNDLHTFTALLYQRLGRLCTPTEFAQVRQQVEEVEAKDSTPQIKYARPPCLPSDLNTTASDDETAGGGAAAAVGASYGPVLPPGWHVDAKGVSRPPADLAETQKRERYRQREHKAQAAYDAVMEVKREPSTAELAQASAVAVLDKAELLALAADLNAAPPHMQRLARLLHLVEERFIDALPPRLRGRVRQEFQDVLDWNAIQRRARGNAVNIVNLVRFVGQQVIAYSAPAKEAATSARMAEICTAVERCEPDVGTTVSSAFEFLFAAIAELRADVAAYSLLLINDTLRRNAAQYIRDFVDACLPAPVRWAKSIAFAQRGVNEERVRTWASQEVPQGWTSITLEERRVRGAVLVGALDLLRSGQHTSLNRWDALPPEVFYFEKHVLFKMANSVQECTLLLLLEGTASSVLTRRGMKTATVSQVILKLHGSIMNLLGEDIKLNALKESVLELVEQELYRLYVLEEDLSDPAKVSAVAAQVTLTESEKATVRSTIDKMTDTQNPLYVTFERRIIQYMELMLVRNQVEVAPIGLVTDTAKELVQLMRRMLVFHWEVYAPYYRVILPLLQVDELS